MLETAVLDRLWVFFGVGDELHEEILWMGSSEMKISVPGGGVYTVCK